MSTLDSERDRAEVGILIAGEDQYLTLVLAGDDYGLPILTVREIVEHRSVTRVPLIEPWVLGVINLRGQVVPVVDLALRFGIERSQPGARSCIVVIEVGDGEDEPVVVGLHVDAVREVVAIDAETIDPPPPFGSSMTREYLTGVGRVGGRLVLLLDVQGLLGAELLDELSASGAARRDQEA